MSRTIQFAFCLHNHQPVGNLDFVMEGAYRQAYLPFLEVLERHPAICMTLHWSGPLIDWLEEARPDYLKRARALVERGQIEVLSGGYYEPILPIIPDRDKVGQIEKLTSKVEELFGTRPEGMWLAERVWEPSLPKPIAQAGIRYAVIDDEHFKGAGLTEEETYGAFLTEEQGSPLVLFPSNAEARDAMPFRSPEEAVGLVLERAGDDPSRLLVMADDGEKFGDWPTTHETVYEQGWLETFFRLLEEHSGVIRLTTFSRYLAEHRPRGKLYLPTASYMEMTRWALPTERVAHFDALRQHLEESGLWDEARTLVRGGFWRSFLVKYPEASRLHAKMMRVAEKVERLEAAGGEPQAVEAARTALWKGQCNCPYWHGVFGGTYIPHLRAANYAALLEAEAIADGHLLEADEVRIESIDYDLDGTEEVILESRHLAATLRPTDGGLLAGLDLKRRGLNLLNTFTRLREAYHADLPADELIYDSHPRLALLDHALAPGTTLEAFARCQYSEQGDFVNQPYEARPVEAEGATGVELTRNGTVSTGYERKPLKVTKTVRLAPGEEGLRVEYHLANPAGEPLEVWFAVEWNFGWITDRDPRRRVELPGHEGASTSPGAEDETHEVSEVRAVDEWAAVAVRLAWDRPATLWRFPVETLSRTIIGVERTYQGTALVPSWAVVLEPGATWTTTFRLVAEDMP
ncbi:MAG: alpha-amylase/4-alpha-glucanotransferase domain-containing protein [bacterium]|nr:alpha-amylase/4-alpha-glucanotransferase domain-containing protein [bacterium]